MPDKISWVEEKVWTGSPDVFVQFCVVDHEVESLRFSWRRRNQERTIPLVRPEVLITLPSNKFLNDLLCLLSPVKWNLTSSDYAERCLFSGREVDLHGYTPRVHRSLWQSVSEDCRIGLD